MKDQEQLYEQFAYHRGVFMVKRVIPLVIVFIVLLSISSIAQFAAVNRAEEKDYLFLDDFDAKHNVYEYPDSIEYYYDERYYHYVDENNSESDIDWAIVYALAYATDGTGIKRIVADRVIATGMDVWYTHGWALYDAATKEFISIDKVDIAKYDGFEKGLAEAKVGKPFGDADLDGELSVLDATYIQRAIARLSEFEDRDDLSQYDTRGVNYDRPLNYISDIDGDGERTILDATAIQMKLARIEETFVTE